MKATSYRSPPLDTCHTEFSVMNKYTYLDTRAHHELGGRWEGANQRQSVKARQSKTTRAIICWPTADLPVNSDY